jgi:serine/threonine protein kinase
LEKEDSARCISLKNGGVDDGVHYAMKVMDKTQIILDDLCTEVMKQRNIIQDVTGVPLLKGLNYAFQTDETLHLILDYCNGGDLHRNLIQQFMTPEKNIRHMTNILLTAMETTQLIAWLYVDLISNFIILVQIGPVVFTIHEYWEAASIKEWNKVSGTKPDNINL